MHALDSSVSRHEHTRGYFATLDRHLAVIDAYERRTRIAELNAQSDHRTDADPEGASADTYIVRSGMINMFSGLYESLLPESTYLGEGNNSYTYRADIDSKAMVIKVPKSMHRAQEAIALASIAYVRLQHRERFERMVAFNPVSGVSITEFMDGTVGDHLDADDIMQIDLGTMHQTIDDLLFAQSHNVIIDPKPGNYILNQCGIHFIDLRSHRVGTPEQSLAQKVGGVANLFLFTDLDLDAQDRDVTRLAISQREGAMHNLRQAVIDVVGASVPEPREIVEEHINILEHIKRLLQF